MKSIIKDGNFIHLFRNTLVVFGLALFAVGVRFLTAAPPMC